MGEAVACFRAPGRTHEAVRIAADGTELPVWWWCGGGSPLPARSHLQRSAIWDFRRPKPVPPPTCSNISENVALVRPGSRAKYNRNDPAAGVP